MCGFSNDTLLSYPLQTVWIVDAITWTVLWPMIEQTTSGLQCALLCCPNGKGPCTLQSFLSVQLPNLAN
jgi:hypothetical protein